MKVAPLVLAVPVFLFGACSDDEPADESSDVTTTAPVADDGEGGDAETGTITVQLEPTEGIFIEGFAIGLRFTDADGEEVKALTWDDFVAELDPESNPDIYYEAVLEQEVPAGTVTVGTDVNIGIGPGPEPPDLEADPMPCELEVEVPAGETVAVEVSFDDATEDCLRIVE
jgi:hypothetical protein